MLVDAAKYGDVEIPVFCYEPKLGPPVGACRMCLVEIEGIPKLQTGVLHAGQGRHGRDHHVRPREERAERGRRVPARQPPARLPGLRQGRRVPAAGHRLRLGPRAARASSSPSATSEAAGAVAARRDRPRALHPLLPLRALLAGGRRGLPAGLPRARRPHLRRHARRPPLRRALQRQHRRALPRGRAHLDRLPLPRAAVGHRGRGLDLHAVPDAVQRRRSPSATTPRCCACWRATTRTSTTAGCATRAASATRSSTRTSASRSRWCATAARCAPSRGSARSKRRPRALDKAGERTAALVGGEATNEEGYLLSVLAAQGARIAAHRLARRAAPLDADHARILARPDLSARVSDIDYAAAVLVLEHRARRRVADPRPARAQGARAARTKVVVATSRPSTLDPNAAALAALRARRRRGRVGRPGGRPRLEPRTADLTTARTRAGTDAGAFQAAAEALRDAGRTGGHPLGRAALARRARQPGRRRADGPRPPLGLSGQPTAPA